ncbi:glycosyl hydrolase family 18 protein [Paenibacillus sp. J5C2022]|uniref:glycosyl hydrolase family 18 protein n=1 Tax=Paenibacillus sp. J5C2022 TaxID=2977129 RepID=UPI0021D1D8AD|nr:glycosyl hydrolase family 18 protein [Paenibacillus sp. J5C2022]
MMRRGLLLLTSALLLLGTFLMPAGQSANAASSGKMTQYRVYQYDKPLKEFAGRGDAIRYAERFSYSHVETIPDRGWVWDNFPEYKVYYNGGQSDSTLEFRTYDQAIATAQSLENAHIRALENTGWVYENYDRYRLYQGDNTLPQWSFRTLEEAKKEARKWSNAHVIDLNSNKWVWDNLTEEQIKQQSEAKAHYRLMQNGKIIQSFEPYAFLKDAVKAAAAYKNSAVLNEATGKIVHNNAYSYHVLQNGKEIKSFPGLQDAVAYAKTLAGSEVRYNGTVLWSALPYLSVYQGNKQIHAFHQMGSALDYAKRYANSSVQTPDGRMLWSNAKALQYLGWNGSGSSTTIISHVENTQGLDIDSPTWFELASADGSLTDKSDASVMKTLKERGILVMPLIHNGFNRTMTSEFLKDGEAQKKFISALVARLSELDVYGVNVDFEEVAGADRAAYTAFVKALTEAAHAKGLKVSIDLPRGSVSWNHKTAYDHAALGGIVDTVIIMAYDEHWRGSETPGSVSSLGWAEEGVKQFLDYGIPRSKLMLGIPFYVREWRLDSDGELVDNRAILMKELPRVIKENDAIGQFHEASGQYMYTYENDGYTHVFWAETEETVLQRIGIAKKYDLAGVAVWRLGYEDSGLWTQMLREK